MLRFLQNGRTLLGFVMETLSPNAIELLIFTFYRISDLFVVFVRMLLTFSPDADYPSQIFLEDILGSAPFICSVLLGPLIIHDLLISFHTIKPLIEFLPSHVYLLECLPFLCGAAHLQLRYDRAVIII